MSKQTKKYTTKTVAPGLAGINQAAELIKQGEVIAFPTETVYGLGADCFNVAALKKIYKAKGRPSDNPVIVHVASTSQVHDVAINISETAKKLMNHFWPGPLTLVFEKKKDVPDIVTYKERLRRRHFQDAASQVDGRWMRFAFTQGITANNA